MAWRQITTKRVEKLVEHYANFLGLGHWTYEIHFKPKKQTRWMEVEYAPPLEHYKVFVYSEYISDLIRREGWDLEAEVGVTVVHELLHVVFSPFESLINFEGETDKAYEWIQEPIIERLAKILYDYLPKIT